MMIEFKNDFSKLLPYDRKEYINFLAGDGCSTKWYGVSFQLPGGSEGTRIALDKFIETYDYLFRKILLTVDTGTWWIVNHSDKDLEWLPNDDDNLPLLRSLFKKNDVPNSFTGALTFLTGDLLKFSKELISYPSVVLSKAGLLYKDLNISHAELQFVIRISGHLNVDFLSTDEDLLKKIVNENSVNHFIIKKYRGTALI